MGEGEYWDERDMSLFLLGLDSLVGKKKKEKIKSQFNAICPLC